MEILEYSNTLSLIIIIQLSCILVFLYLIFRSFTSRTTPPKHQPAKKLQKKEVRIKKKYRNTGLTDQLAKAFKDKIVLLMNNEKIFMESDLKLKDLADKLGISLHQTSQIINQYFKKDFNTFINGYRVMEAIRLFKDNPEISISDVAHQVGFNNNVTFNNAFKKVTQNTPSNYLNKISSGNKVKQYNS